MIALAGENGRTVACAMSAPIIVIDQQRGTDCGQSRHQQQHRADNFHGSGEIPEPLTEPDRGEQLHHRRGVAELVEAGQKKLRRGQDLERPHQSR